MPFKKGYKPWNKGGTSWNKGKELPRSDITGKKFGRLTAIKFIRMGNNFQSYWLFRCDCGNEIETRLSRVNYGHTKSCGCISKERPTKTPLRLRHKMASKAKSPYLDYRFYMTWSGMKARCLNPNATKFGIYGGRGIKVCERWMKFENFRDDMYESYKLHVEKFGKKNTSIERRNSDGDYEPQNCLWATCREQMQNTRRSRPISYGGKTQVISEWARELGMNPRVIEGRIYRGWPIEVALTKEVR